MSAEPSIIGNVVGSFQATLNLAEEALVHAREAESRTRDAFVFYRQAFGDSESSVVKAASAEAESSLALTRAGLAAVQVANQAIRDFSLAIAPSLSLSESSEPRDSPSGEQLLDTVKRPRNFKDFAKTITRESENSATLINKSMDAMEKSVSLLRPPDPSGVSTVTQSSPPVLSRTPGATGTGDPVLTGALVFAMVVKVVQTSTASLRKSIFGGKKS